jgi:hypothetical protein
LIRIRLPETAEVDLKNIPLLSGAKIMTKERKSNREGKKKPAMTTKEKKAAKKSKRESKNVFENDKVN